MAVRSFSAILRRFQSRAKATCPIEARLVTSSASPIEAADESSADFTNSKNSFMSEILKARRPRRSVTALLQERVESGHAVTVSELRSMSRQLIKYKHYAHALEMMEWKEAQKGFQISAADHAYKLKLIIRICGMKEGEEYFARLSNSASQKAAYRPLLHKFIKERYVDKAEAFMEKLNDLGLLIDPHPFNEMMKLYAATSQYEKVPLVITQMKQNKIPRNVLSYNIWMNACGEVSGVASVDTVYKEMMNDKNVEVGWSTLCTLANVYIKAGRYEKAVLVLENAEKKLNTSNRLGYFFIITLYASLKNREGVLRLWEACKSVGGKITCANYMSILSCLVKIGDLVEAERVFREWESYCRNYDIRVSNVLLGAYARIGLMDKAESLHRHSLKRGGCPNYKTWEILMEGWVKSQNMGKAIDEMNKAFTLMKHCRWRPSQEIVMAIAEHYEKHGNLEEASAHIRLMHRFGLASLPLYRLVLKMHANSHRPAFDILEMMEKDKIEMNDETSALSQAVNK